MSKQMQIIDNVLSGLWNNKLRSVLTLSGVIIGIASVIVLLSVSQAVQAYIQSKLAIAGTNQITISNGGFSIGGTGRSGDSFKSLTSKDYNVLTKMFADKVVAISASSNYTDNVSLGEYKTTTTVKGVLGDHWLTADVSIDYGRKIADSNSTPKVVVLGSEIAAKIRPVNTSSLLGENIKVGSSKYRIIGINKAKGSAGVVNPDMEILIPMKSANLGLEDNISTITLKVKEIEDIAPMKAGVEAALREYRGVPTNKETDFKIYDSGELLQIFNSIKDILTGLLLVTGLLTLIVAGLGIMNIMLSNVTQRTREIGLMKAIGASNGNIIEQYLAESMIITTSGGLIGIVLGIFIQIISIAILRSLFDGQIELAIYPAYIVLALVVSVVLGIVFGIYPALNAAKLTPISALKQ